ncbi:AAA family ATPase [bacterium]|nr:AAA family ATPase [bacterium]NIN93298.1 AAA family ATPase [bacterium]NIO19093.1 AAA family ATPase [bacterium]NIO74224.1 AAA family ATPase [bacterium]
MASKKIVLKSNREAVILFGQYDSNLRLIESTFPIELFARGNTLTIKGNSKEVKDVERLIGELLKIVRKNEVLRTQQVESAMDIIRSTQRKEQKKIFSDVVYLSEKGKEIKPKTLQQKVYVDAVRNYDIVFSIGPAGTGKTYLACACALQALKEERVERIILTRPVVEAGEKLGFLPGDLYEKINPYLHPLYDAFYSMIGPEKFQKYRKQEIIEIIPLAYMRGRTLDDAFIILDEAQNTTLDQMKMLLTRLGFDAQVVVTGDITQVDLEDKKCSGLIQVQGILKKIKGIKFIYFTQVDVIRHQLVKKIITAYEEFERKR